MATLIVGPNDLTKKGKNMTDKTKLSLNDLDIIKTINTYDDEGVDITDIDVILYVEGKDSVIIKAPNKTE